MHECINEIAMGLLTEIKIEIKISSCASETNARLIFFPSFMGMKKLNAPCDDEKKRKKIYIYIYRERERENKCTEYFIVIR